jgi:translation initiation factor 1
MDQIVFQADLIPQLSEEDKLTETEIHIRMRQRNGKSFITTVEGLDPKIDKKKILGVLKRKLNCNGTILNDEEHGEIIQMQGDQRKSIAAFLISEKLATKNNVVLHG